jgi:ribose transport system permease protein
MQSGQPASSDGLEFDAITGAVLGGVGLMGGTGDMVGCLIGLLIMTGFNNGLQVMNVQSFWQKVARGLLLIVALGLDYARTVQSQKVKINRTETPAAPAPAEQK